MAASHIRARVALGALAGIGALVVAACSSSSPPPITGAPAVRPNGRHYSYDQGSVAMSSWPKACSLLPAPSAAAALGTAVTTKAFHHRCFYVPGNDSFPTLTVTILGIGSAQRDTFARARDANAGNHPRAVAGVGRAAVLYPVPGSPTVNLDVRAGQGVFEIALRSPVGNETGAADAQAILVKVGRALASEFRG